MPGYEGEADCSMRSAEKCQVSQKQQKKFSSSYSCIFFNYSLMPTQNNYCIGLNFHDALPFPLFLQYLQFCSLLFPEVSIIMSSFISPSCNNKKNVKFCFLSPSHLEASQNLLMLCAYLIPIPGT